MPRPKPSKLHDELDALLDGRPVELTDELAPLAEAADQLRAELAGYQLDPAVADRHLEQVLQGSAPVVPLPVRDQPDGWALRRRVAAVALAAALVLAPATMASAAALPGQAMYPFKRAIEQLRIASVQWSPPREAGERTRVAEERLEELNRLVKLEMFSQLPTAVVALEKAVLDAQAAVAEAGQESRSVAKAVAKLHLVKQAGSRVLATVVATVTGQERLPEGTRDAIEAAVAQSQDVLLPPDREVGSTGTPTTAAPTTATMPGGTPDPTSLPPPPPASATSGPAPATTEPATTEPTTTEPTTTEPTTTQPTTTESTATPGSSGSGGAGAEERASAENVPATTIPVP